MDLFEEPIFKLEHLASGGQGDVYSCYDTFNEIDCAVKFITLKTHPIFTSVNTEEVYQHLLKAQQHSSSPPSLLRVYRVESVGDLMNIYMQKHSNATSLDISKLSKSSIDEKKSIILSLADALEYLHTHHIAHRDVCYDNILIVDGMPILCDFELAQYFPSKDEKFYNAIAMDRMRFHQIVYSMMRTVSDMPHELLSFFREAANSFDKSLQRPIKETIDKLLSVKL